jgi:hypothetical protein
MQGWRGHSCIGGTYKRFIQFRMCCYSHDEDAQQPCVAHITHSRLHSNVEHICGFIQFRMCCYSHDGGAQQACVAHPLQGRSTTAYPQIAVIIQGPTTAWDDHSVLGTIVGYQMTAVGSCFT